MEDNDIMVAVRGGDIEKLGLLFQKHNKQLYTYFLLATRNRTTSEDLVQEVFFRILKYRHTYDREKSYKTWMYATAHNVRTDYFKKREKDHEYCEEPDDHESSNPGPDELLEHKNNIFTLKKALNELPGDQREVLILSRFNNMRYEEIGTILGCSTGAVKVRVFRALTALTEIYCKLFPEKFIMDCKKIKELAPDYILDILDNENRLSLEEHLAACPECRQAVEYYRQVWVELGRIPQEEPSQRLQTKFDAMLETFRSEPDEAKQKVALADKLNQWLEKWWSRRPAFQLGTAFVFLVFGLALGQMVQLKGSSSSELARLKKEVQETRQLVTLALLNEPSAGDRLRGVAMSSSVKDPDDRFLTVLMNTLNYDPNENVRLAAVDASAAFTNREWVRTELVTALSRQTSPLVQISLINLLASIREKKAVEVFQAIINDENYLEQVKNRAKLGIEETLG